MKQSLLPLLRCPACACALMLDTTDAGPYEGIYPLIEAQVREWAVLDTFDMLSPVHDHPQSAEAAGPPASGAAARRSG